MAPPVWAYQVEYYDPLPDDELICSICHAVFCDPVESPCKHVYCRICITKWLENNRNCPICRKRTTKHVVQEVVPIVKNMIMKLVLRCHNMEKGCDEKFSLEQCEGHIKDCGYETVRCRNKPCKETLMRKELEDHEIQNCRYRYVRCDTCNLKISSLAPNRHNCIKALKMKLKKKMEIIKGKDSKLKDLQDEIKKLKEAAEASSDETSSSSSVDSVSAGDVMINMPSLSGGSSFESDDYINESDFDEDDDDDFSPFRLTTSSILGGLERHLSRFSRTNLRGRFGFGNSSIEYPRTSSPTVREDSNVAVDPLNSTLEEEPQMRRPPAKRRLPPRTLDTSEEENDRDLELPSVPSPKRSWCLFSKGKGQSSSQAATSTQSADESTSRPCSSKASGSRPNTPITNSFKLRSKVNKSGAQQVVPVDSAAAPRSRNGIFERTIALLEQYSLESDPEWLPTENAGSGSDSNVTIPTCPVPEGSSFSDSSEDSYNDNNRENALLCLYGSSSSEDDPDWIPHF